MRTTVLINLLLVIISIGQAVVYIPRLPDRVATRFNFQGAPTGWMDRGSFLAFSIIFPAVLAILFGGLALAVEWSASEGRNRTADPRARSSTDERTSARQKLCQNMSSFLRWLGGGTLGLFLILGHLSIRANLSDPPLLRGAMPIVAVYLVLLIVFAARLGIQEHRVARELRTEPLPANIWFPAKRMGWGWGLPVRWQGWVALLTWIGLLFGGLAVSIPRLERDPAWLLAMLAFMPVMVVLLIALCWWKGEKPRWRWGD